MRMLPLVRSINVGVACLADPRRDQRSIKRWGIFGEERLCKDGEKIKLMWNWYVWYNWV